MTSSNLNQPNQIAISPFTVTSESLEQLMALYKDRGSSFADINYFTARNGIDNLVSSLQTDKTQGIKADTVVVRREHFDSNELFTEPVKSFCFFVLEALNDTMLKVLIVSAVIQIIIGVTVSENVMKDLIDGLSVILAVFVVVSVSSVTNCQKEKKFNELITKQKDGSQYEVIRQGCSLRVNAGELVVGDLLCVKYGEIIPADAVLIEGNGVRIDEAALTGESKPKKKEVYEKCAMSMNSFNASSELELNESERVDYKAIASPLMLSGTNCIEGSGKAIVLAVGTHSQNGLINRTIDNAKETKQTPLEIKLDSIAIIIGYFGMIAGIVTFISLSIGLCLHYNSLKKSYQNAAQYQQLLASYLSNNPSQASNKTLSFEANSTSFHPSKYFPNQIVNIIILCISIIVVAIPEGLPLAVTLSLAFSVKTMMEKNNLVRKMKACETMGEANYICTDKTGTLTRNEMRVVTIITGDGATLQLDTEKGCTDAYNNSFLSEMTEAIEMNIDVSNTTNQTDKAFELFLKWINRRNPDEMRDIKDKVCFNFNSNRKRMTTFVHDDSLPTGYRLFTKGSSEKVESYCRSYIDPHSGKVCSLKENKAEIMQCINKLNKEQLRTLYVCYRDITKEQYEACEALMEFETNCIDQSELILLAICGLRDSLREGVTEAVDKCKLASVSVIMITGDNIITAASIAKECHILDADSIITDDESITSPNEERIELSQISSSPNVISGSAFYSIIGGLYCESCQTKTAQCKCPMTEQEALLLSSSPNTAQSSPLLVKREKIKDLEAFIKLLQTVKVIARAQPIHKYALVLGLKELGNVVAVTGDGTNDAPALSKADVGFSMFSGTDIAKEASDIIIMDNNFTSITTAIMYGRSIFDNIRKFLQFQLTVNLCACCFVFFGVSMVNESPLTPTQMLWVNLIMDSLGSLALATEIPYDALLNRKPTKKNESIINGKMWKHILFQAAFHLVILMLLYLFAPEFIKEHNLISLAENGIIKHCYGALPGNKTNEDFVLYGTFSHWSPDVKLLPQMTEESCGRYFFRKDLSSAFAEYQASYGSTTHMTIVFNVFVLYTLFNQFNCSVIDDSINICNRIGGNTLFILITSFEILLQCLIVQFGKGSFHVNKYGLSLVNWLICIGLSLSTFAFSFLIKKIPIDTSIQRLLNRKSNEEKEKPDYARGNLKQKQGYVEMKSEDTTRRD